MVAQNWKVIQMFKLGSVLGEVTPSQIVEWKSGHGEVMYGYTVDTGVLVLVCATVELIPEQNMATTF